MRQNLLKLSNRLLGKETAPVLEAAPELDLVFYRSTYADLGQMDDSALARHWLNHGKKEGRHPSAASISSEVRTSSANAGGVIDDKGAQIEVPAELDIDFYRRRHADLGALSDASLVKHWEDHGKREGRMPSFSAMLASQALSEDALPSDFAADVYLALNPAIRGIGIMDQWSAAEHYLLVGATRKLDYQFDEDFYRHYYRDLSMAKVDLLAHYIENGKSEGRVKTSKEYWKSKQLNGAECEAFINPAEFAALNADLARADIYLATKWNVVDFLLADGIAQMRPIAADRIASSRAYCALGDALMGKGDVRLAEKSYLAACHFDAAFVSPIQHLADFYLTEKRYAESLEFYRFAIEADKRAASNFWARYNSSVAYDALGDAVNALDQLQAARRADPNMHIARHRHEELVKREWEAFDVRASAALKIGRKDEAKRLYAKANALIDTLFEAYPVPAQPVPETPRIALVVDPFLPQCVRYRVNQKLEQFKLLQWDVTCLHWPDITQASFDTLAFADVVIFYRTPAVYNVMRLMKQCRHAGKAVVYEIDDLVFDTELYPEPLQSYGGLVSADEYMGLTRGAILFGEALQQADYALSSTEPLASRMASQVRKGRAFIHRNGLDIHTQPYLELERPKLSPAPMIFYGTGTKAHNADFDDLVAPALARIMNEFPEWKLLIAGYLTVPACLAEFEERIVRIGFVSDVDAYTRLLGQAEINIAVLHDNVVNDAKSELKWFEAGALGIPSVVSATRNYRDVAVPDNDVLFANDPDEWYVALRKLVVDPTLRQTIGDNARTAARRYAVAEQAQSLKSMFQELAVHWNDAAGALPGRDKIVITNVFFAPQSIGGATRVVEDNVQILLEQYADRYDIEIFTSDHENPAPYHVQQYGWNGIRVTKVSTPQKAGMDWDYNDEKVGAIFDEFLLHARPKLVHFHCVQRLTASIVDVTRERGIPYLITAHDAWWISDYQFLVDPKGNVVDMNQSDLAVLSRQTKDLGRTLQRQSFLRKQLNGAKSVLAVSEAFAEIYRINGFTNVSAVRNGVMPHAWVPRTVSVSGKVRIAHIGGMSAHKGYDLFRKALASHDYQNIEAIVVDLSKPYGYRKKETFGKVPVTYIGRVGHDEITELYSLFDVLAAPSIWPESFGLVTREAVAAGCWVIASDIGAIGEDVVLGRNGFVVSAGSLDKLERVFHEIETNPHRYLECNQDRSVRKAEEQVTELLGIYSAITMENENAY